jgi:hypothetical protein
MVGEKIESRDYFWNDFDRGKWKSLRGGGPVPSTNSPPHTPHVLA